MKCSKCGFENPEGMNFCGKCSAKLELICPNCSAFNPPEFTFCGKCAHDLRIPNTAPPLDLTQPRSYTPKHLSEKILTARSALEGERKLVTVLFADVANFTSLSEKLDPEEVHQLMDGCFRILMDEIHRCEGTINQFTGDGVMALFGAPVAHEDHAQRACHAALAIQKALGEYGEKVEKECGVPFRMRVGVNSGLVIVGAIGDDLRMDYTAVGDTTNLAARMQQAARPGEAWVSAATYALVRDYFHHEPVGTVEVKGKREPQSTYRLLSERAGVYTRFDAGLVRGVTELVGRRPEMEALRSALERAKSGQAQVIDVVGEAGVGKSRLAYEFRKALGNEATFLTGLCVHYGRSINFLPVINVVREVFGIEEGMSESEAGLRIAGKAAGTLAAMIPFYRNLLSLPVDDPKFKSLSAEGRKFGTFEAVKDLLVALSREKPLVVFVDDAHWIDKISQELFTYCSRSVLSHPILLLTSYRPEATPGWAQGAHYQRLGIETLSASSSIRLVRNLLGGVGLEAALEQKIAEKTGGNPFFVEEIVRELVDRGDLVRSGERYVCVRPMEQCEIPGTVQGVLAARMDRLSEDLKKTMQVASVIGRDFAYRLLRSILDLGDELRARLTNLVGLEILYEKALYPELEYIFKHALTQEVAYESLLKQRRQEIHGRIARAIEELYAARLEPHCELLAHHWELSDAPDRSIEYLVLAGEKSGRTQAAHAAVNFFTRALAQIECSGREADPGLLMRIREGRAVSSHVIEDIEQSFADYQEAIRLARSAGDRGKLLHFLSLAPWPIYNTTLKDRVPALCEEGLELAQALGDRGAEGLIMGTHAYWRYQWQGSDEYATIRRGFEMVQGSGHPLAILGLLPWALQERWRGNPRRTLELLAGVPEALESQFNVLYANNVILLFAWSLTEVGRYEEAVRRLNHGVESAERNALHFFLVRYYNTLGWAHAEVCDFETASRYNRRALEIVHASFRKPVLIYPFSELRAMSEVNLMENDFDLGEVDEAWHRLMRLEQEALSSDYDFMRDRWTARMQDLKGTILLTRGDLDGAEAAANQCLAVATKRHYRKYLGRAERLLGQVLAERGAYDPAEAKLTAALTELEAVGNPKQRWITHTALARHYAKMGRPDREREQRQQAARVVQSTADGLRQGGLRDTFLQAAPVRDILDNSGL